MFKSEVIEAFINTQAYIHVSSVEEAESIYNFFTPDRSLNSSNADNCLDYPYLVCAGRSIGADSSPYYGRMVFEYADCFEDDIEFEKSAMPIELLFGEERR